MAVLAGKSVIHLSSAKTGENLYLSGLINALLTFNLKERDMATGKHTKGVITMDGDYRHRKDTILIDIESRLANSFRLRTSKVDVNYWFNRDTNNWCAKAVEVISKIDSNGMYSLSTGYETIILSEVGGDTKSAGGTAYFITYESEHEALEAVDKAIEKYIDEWHMFNSKEFADFFADFGKRFAKGALKHSIEKSSDNER